MPCRVAQGDRAVAAQRLRSGEVGGRCFTYGEGSRSSLRTGRWRRRPKRSVNMHGADELGPSVGCDGVDCGGDRQASMRTRRENSTAGELGARPLRGAASLAPRRRVGCDTAT